MDWTSKEWFDAANGIATALLMGWAGWLQWSLYRLKTRSYFPSVSISEYQIMGDSVSFRLKLDNQTSDIVDVLSIRLLKPRGYVLSNENHPTVKIEERITLEPHTVSFIPEGIEPARPDLRLKHPKAMSFEVKMFNRSRDEHRKLKATLRNLTYSAMSTM